MARQQVIIWAAGFFDGEGCVVITSPQFQVRAIATQSDERPIRLLQETFGGSVYNYRRPGNDRNQWYWIAIASKAQAFYEAILPYSVVKREQIEIALEAFQLVGRKGRLGTSYCNSEGKLQREEERKMCKERLRVLKRPEDYAAMARTGQPALATP